MDQSKIERMIEIVCELIKKESGVDVMAMADGRRPLPPRNRKGQFVKVKNQRSLFKSLLGL